MILNNYRKQIDKIAKRDDVENLFDELCELSSKGKVGIIESNALGLVVVKPTIVNESLCMLVWLAISNGQNNILKYHNYFINLAHEMGAKYIEFQTKRKGFAKVAKRFNFNSIGTNDGFTVYRKEV